MIKDPAGELQSWCIPEGRHKSNDWYSYKKRREPTDTEIHKKEDHVKMEVEIGVMLPQAQGHQEAQGTGRVRERFFPRALDTLEPCWHLDFRLLTSRIVRKQIPVVLSHPICSNFYGNPWKLIQILVSEVRCCCNEYIKWGNVFGIG